MTGLLAILALGFVLGMRHATDPDHVVAITTIVSRQRSVRGAALIGVAWGLGHTLTILVVGGAIIVLQWKIPPRVGLSMELAVGVMLILLGVFNLVGIFKQISVVAPLAETAQPADQTRFSRLDRRLGALAPYRLARPLVIGVVHGLAGSAAVALLVLAAIQDRAGALLYLLLFGIGTIVGMMLVTAAIAVPFSVSAGRFAATSRGLRVAAGLLSVGFGLMIAYQVGIVDGLFADAPHWTPR